MRSRTALGLMLAAVATAGPMFAQDAAQPSGGPLATLQTKSAIADEDRATLRAWLSEKLSSIVGDAATAAAAVAAVREEFKGTAAFREAYAGAALETFAPAVKTASPAAAAQLVAVVGSFGELSAARALIESLSDARPAVRAAAAAGLKNLRVKLGAPGASGLVDAIDALRDAARKEKSAGALQAMYAALNFPEAGVNLSDAKPLAAAVIDVLDARGEQYSPKPGGAAVAAEAADLPGLLLAGSLAKSLTDAERERLSAACAKMLRHCTERYVRKLHSVSDKASPMNQIELRSNVELIIEETERLLAESLKPNPAPTVAKFLREGKKIAEMETEYAKWAKLFQDKLNLSLPIAPAGE